MTLIFEDFDCFLTIALIWNVEFGKNEKIVKVNVTSTNYDSKKPSFNNLINDKVTKILKNMNENFRS